jgi:two-component system sensor kinase
MGELEARIREVDHGLRELAHSLEPASLYGRTFEQLQKHEVTSFSSRTEIEADLTATGDFSTLSASQRFALLLVVKEALSNVREHSAATAARVTVTVRRDRIEGEIWDNGQGFAVERALVRAAKNGRLGLVGMGERMRLLGGKLEIHSHPGGPTLTRFTIPAWQPLVAGDQQFARRHGESISVRA